MCFLRFAVYRHVSSFHINSTPGYRPRPSPRPPPPNPKRRWTLLYALDRYITILDHLDLRPPLQDVVRNLYSTNPKPGSMCCTGDLCSKDPKPRKHALDIADCSYGLHPGNMSYRNSYRSYRSGTYLPSGRSLRANRSICPMCSQHLA